MTELVVEIGLTFVRSALLASFVSFVLLLVGNFYEVLRDMC